ncbi:MAG: extensin family protein [Roseovarius sp.]
MRVLWVIPLILMGCSPIESVRGIFKSDDAKQAFSAEGSVCGIPAIKGTVVGDVPGPGGCGVSDAVSVTSVSGITLSQPATINCQTATTLNTWVAGSVMPTIGNTGDGLTSLKVAAHYACRTRNHKKGARLSEHAKGNAIDISAFRLADGSAITVSDHWNNSKRGKILKELHKTACGPFGTVLGPKSDRYHQNHFHLDVADYRSGPYCR